MFFLHIWGDIINIFSKNKKSSSSNLSFQQWLSVSDISDGIITTNGGKKISVLKVKPINFKLRSELEQNAILNQYKLFLKNLDSKIQIIVSSRKKDISNHINDIFKFTNENPELEEFTDDYISLVKQIVLEKGCITKDFFVVFEGKQDVNNYIGKITEYLGNCGNEVNICTKKEIEDLFKNYINKRLYNA